MRRCAWARHPLAIRYHDRVSGVPVKNDRKLFEFLILEGAQVGLSWDTILAKHANYRRAFDGFDPRKVARYGAAKKRRLLADAGIVRNRAKVASAVANAKAFLAVQAEFGSFSKYVWGFTGGKPIVNQYRTMKTVPAQSVVSDALSKDLKQRGFNFVGSASMYAFMQAVGTVDDHIASCFRRKAGRR